MKIGISAWFLKPQSHSQGYSSSNKETSPKPTQEELPSGKPIVQIPKNIGDISFKSPHQSMEILRQVKQCFLLLPIYQSSNGMALFLLIKYLVLPLPTISHSLGHYTLKFSSLRYHNIVISICLSKQGGDI